MKLVGFEGWDVLGFELTRYSNGKPAVMVTIKCPRCGVGEITTDTGCLGPEYDLGCSSCRHDWIVFSDGSQHKCFL